MLRDITCQMFRSFVIAICLVQFVSQAYSQATNVQIREVADGFEATVYLEKYAFKIINNEYENRHFRTLIQDLSGRKIAETSFENSIVEVSLGGMVLRFSTEKNGTEGGIISEIPEGERLRLEEYLRTTESNDLRTLVAELTKRQGALKPRSLKGLLILSLVLGEPPNKVSNIRNTRKLDTMCRVSNPTIIFASFTSQERGLGKLSSPFLSTGLVCDSSNCCGCCGVGCSGCTGCYTSACYLHDRCVDLYGHPACLGLLPAAIASIVNECMMLLE